MADQKNGPDKPKTKPISQSKGKKGDERRDRLSASLRANLRRRKDQMRSRARPETDENPPDPAAEGEGNS